MSLYRNEEEIPCFCALNVWKSLRSHYEEDRPRRMLALDGRYTRSYHARHPEPDREFDTPKTGRSSANISITLPGQVREPQSRQAMMFLSAWVVGHGRLVFWDIVPEEMRTSASLNAIVAI